MRLAGLLIIRDGRGSLWRAARRELRRVGPLRFLDVAAFRAYSRLKLSRRDRAWKAEALERLKADYPASLDDVPRLVVSNPNGPEAKAFLDERHPDIVIARCKVILKRELYTIPRTGTFVLHPGICPEYRNAHGCFWALANRDLDRVGMTLLKVDDGIDTGPIYLQAGCQFNEVDESHNVIQYRAVLDNLDAVGRTLLALWRGDAIESVPIEGRKSATWGQPQLSAYLRWKRAARLSSRRPVNGLRAFTPGHEGTEPVN